MVVVLMVTVRYTEMEEATGKNVINAMALEERGFV